MTRNVTRFGSILRASRLTNQSGSVLATVLVVLIILLSIFLSAMTYALSRYGRHMANQNRLAASHLSDAGVSRTVALLQEERFRPGTQEWTAPNGGRITVETSAWGPYVQVRSLGKYRGQEVATVALIGTSHLNWQSAAITMTDESNPLVIAGHTRIIGDVNTGSQGMMEGQFRGEGVTYPDYHKGVNRKYAALDVPALDTAVFDHYKRELRQRRGRIEHRLSGSVVLDSADIATLNSYTTVRIENNLRFQNVNWQRWDRTVSFFVDGSVEITGQTRLSGLIEIVAGGTITVSDSASVDNVILSAEDSVVVRDAAKSSAILISEGSIIVRDRASLTYPSLLLCDVPEGPTQPGGIYLRSRGILESVCYLREKSFHGFLTDRFLYVDTVSQARGTLISQSYTDLRGRLDGCSMTERYYFAYPPTTYLNWLKDATIDRTRLDFTPVLPALDVDTASWYVLRQDRAS